MLLNNEENTCHKLWMNSAKKISKEGIIYLLLRGEHNGPSPTLSDWQGYDKPSGLEGKGSKGRGQGRHLATLEKPLPLTRVSRIGVYVEGEEWDDGVDGSDCWGQFRGNKCGGAACSRP